jgi:hypothetical protein
VGFGSWGSASATPSGCISTAVSVIVDVAELLFVCGVIVFSEAIRQWCLKFG